MRYSVVVPFHNEEECVEKVIVEMADVMHGLDDSFEILAVDDGSTDRTLPILKQLKERFPEMRVLSSGSRGGQSAALFFGWRSARGDIILTLDGDGQNDPSGFPEMVKCLKRADMVVGVRVQRRDRFVKRVSSKIANFIRSIFLGDKFTDIGCGMRVMKREVCENLPFFTSIHRFAPALASRLGYTVIEMPVGHRARLGGVSKYGTLDRSLIGMADLFGVAWLKKRVVSYRLEEE